MLITMAKIEMIGSKKYFDKAIALLQQLGTLHIEDLSKNEEALPVRAMDMDPIQLESRNNLRNLFTRINGVISIFEPLTIDRVIKEDKDLWEQDNSFLTREAEKLLSNVEEQSRKLVNKKHKLQLELASLARYEQVLKKVYPLTRKVMSLQDSESVAFLLEGDYKETVNVINDEINKIAEGNFELISTAVDENTTAAIIVFDKKYSNKIHKFLTSKVKEIEVPTDVKDLSVDKVLAEIGKKKQKYPEEIAKADAQLKPLADEWYGKLKTISNAIANRVDQIESIHNFAQTDYTFVLHAWLPYKELGNLKKAIKDEWDGKIVVRQLELTQHEYEEAPVVLKNPGWANPFQIFTQVFQSPKYGTIDPTIYIAVFFPIFFGFIVGDMGYGLIIFLTATFLRFKLRHKNSELINTMTRILQIAGVSTFLFGAFYGEAFGDLLEKFLHSHHLVEKFTFSIGSLVIPYGRNPEIPGRIMQLLLISLAIGFVHLVTSLIMGVTNAIKEKAYKHMWEKTGALLFFVPIALILFSLVPNLLGSPVNLLPFLANPAIKSGAGLISVVGVVLIAYGGGLVGSIEYTIGLIGNYFSYLRLMALGLAGVILAAVANSFVESFGSLGILMAVFLHVINVVVHTVTPAIHSFRLNLLEGFGKFYEEGGKEYKPFEARR